MISSYCNESAFLLPQNHCKIGFRSGHVLEFCDFSIKRFCSKLRKNFVLKIPSTDIEAVLYMSEAHSIGKREVNCISLEFFLWDAHCVQLRCVSLHLEQILRRCHPIMSFEEYSFIILHFFFYLLLCVFLLFFSFHLCLGALRYLSTTQAFPFYYNKKTQQLLVQLQVPQYFVLLSILLLFYIAVMFDPAPF